MAPKKKLTKEEQEAERQRQEEEAKAAEQERLKQLELESARRIEEAKRRAELKAANEEKEANRLNAARLEAEDLMKVVHEARDDHVNIISAGEEWNRYISCNPLPKPTDESSVGEFLAAEAATVPESVEEAVDRMQAVLSIVQEINSITIWQAQLSKDHSKLLERKEELLKLVSRISDMATAWFLHRCDYFADDDGGIRFEHKLGACQWGIWLNVTKNPRTKIVEYPQLNLTVEIQKQVALAPVAIRVQILPTIDEFNDVCTNELMAAGPVISVDLLSLPPACKTTVRQWVIRFHGPLTNTISKIPYPIPPAGADPNSWSSEEDIAPLTVTADATPKLAYLGQQELQVGCWNAQQKQWSTTKIKSTELAEGGRLSFKTVCMGSFAVVFNRCRLMPYQAWYIRPSAGDGGGEATLALDVGIPDKQFEFQVGAGTVALKEPCIECFAHLLRVPMQPIQLLRELQATGVCLMPRDTDAPTVDVDLKEHDVERAMCTDVSSLAGSHVIASSKWTQYVGEHECICRISEVTDWEMGGRCSDRDVQRIFDLEKESGAGRVVAMVRRGLKGVTFSKSLNRCTEYQELPAYDTDRYASCIWGEVHATPLALLHAKFEVELVDEVEISIVKREEEEQKLRVAESKRMAELEEYAKKGEKPPDELLVETTLPKPDLPLYWPTNWIETAEGLKPADGTLQRIENFNPLTSETLAHLMFALRIFSFSVA